MTVFNRDKIIMRSKSLVTHRGVYHTEKLRFATKDSTVGPLSQKLLCSSVRFDECTRWLNYGLYEEQMNGNASVRIPSDRESRQIERCILARGKRTASSSTVAMQRYLCKQYMRQISSRCLLFFFFFSPLLLSERLISLDSLEFF